MPNGNGLLGGLSSFQPVLAVQNLADPDLYYLFTTGEWIPFGTSDGLYYSVIDMNLNDDLGDIVTSMKNIAIPSAGDAYQLLTATRHRNNKDVWVVVFKQPGTQCQYAAYLITSAGISATPVLSLSGFSGRANPLAGQMRISLDGSKLFCPQDTLAEYCHFDNLTGIVTPYFRFKPQQGIQSPYRPLGAEFSRDARYLYISTNTANPNSINDSTLNAGFQYDANQTNLTQFLQTEYLVAYGYYHAMQEGPDGKIYCCPNGWTASEHFLYRINSPSLQGPACNFQVDAIDLEGRSASGSLPQFIQRYFLYISHNGQCQFQPVFFSTNLNPPADSVHWNFGDPASGMDNTSTLLNPMHIYMSSGTYNVKIFVRYNDNRIDSSLTIVNILPAPNPILGPDTMICNGTTVTFDAGSCSGCSYVWSNLTLGQPNIGTGQTYTTGLQSVYKVTVDMTGGCSDSDTVGLVVVPNVFVTTFPLTKTICSSDSTNIMLTANLSGTSFSWTVTNFSPDITGFSNGNGNYINQFLVNNGSVPGTVTYTIVPANTTCIGIPSDFIVTIQPRDTISISISSSSTELCEGSSVTLAATSFNPGLNPSYQWRINHADTGSYSPVFIYTPMNNDTVQCILTSSLTGCIENNPATSDSIVLTLLPLFPINVSIASSANPGCESESVTFTATPINGGTSPTFQWLVNGNLVGTNDSTYIYVPSDGDQVCCLLTSSEQCTTNNPATSDTITMKVNPLLPVDIDISASTNPVCEGIPVTFTAHAVNGGSAPVYQWYVNGINVGTNDPVFTYYPASGDQVSVILTSSEPCTSGNPASGNPVIMIVVDAPEVTFTPCFDTLTTTNAKPIILRGGIPLGGMYSGTGVTSWTGGSGETGWTFDPVIAGPGIHQITYSYTNLGSCEASSTLSIINYPLSVHQCGAPMLDVRDSSLYPTIQIGAQCWMATDLNYGTEISLATPQRDNCIPEKYSPPSSLVPHPSFYQWDELMDYRDAEEVQGLCPPGWHIPSESDWNILFANWTNNAFAGEPLKYTGYSGFNAFLNGVGYLNKGWWFGDEATFFWSSTSNGSYKAWAHGMHEVNFSVSYYPSYRSNAFSVRCLHD